MNKLETTLGVPLLEDKHWKIDLKELKIFTGLSVLSQIIGDQIFDELESGTGDIHFLYKLNPNINPELIQMQIYSIQISSESGILDELSFRKEDLQNYLRTIFGTFQRPTWAKYIHPEFFNEDQKKFLNQVLVFQFENLFFLLSRSSNERQIGKFFLRLKITNENPFDSLKNTESYHLVTDVQDRKYIAGTSKLAESISEKVLTSVQKNLTSYVEEKTSYNLIFSSLEKTFLSEVEQICFHFSSSFTEEIQNLSKFEQVQVYKKIFLTFEDKNISEEILKEKIIEIETNKNIRVFLYTSRKNKFLNLSFGEVKKTLSLENYLDKMQILKSILKEELDFKNVSIFLIHHITSEILAVIELIRNLKPVSLDMMFVKYAGKIPEAYLDSLFNINDENFFMAGLSRHLSEDNKEYFSLAKYYSDLKGHEIFSKELETERLKFYEAMKKISVYFFLHRLEKTIFENKKILVIEDGGYLSPILNEYMFLDRTIGEIYEEFSIPTKLESSKKLKDILDEFLIGTIEHTRNGYDKLQKVKSQFQKFETTTYSIAISNEKVIEESKEVAHSILSAIESILHGQGKILSKRNIIILGAKGNIGSFLVRYLLGGRLHDTNLKLVEVDLKCNEKNSGYKFLSDIPKNEFLDLDLFIGVIGDSILKSDLIKELILKGNKRDLFFASGSTKTVEFSDLTEYIYSILDNPNILTEDLSIQISKILDPQTLMNQGSLVKLKSKKVEKNLYFLGDLSPINFLYYGVPTETMDKILAQLIQISLGMVKNYNAKNIPEKGIYAVDKEIDEWGNLL